MNKSMTLAVVEANTKCLGDAILMTLGKEGLKLATAPLDKALPKELAHLTSNPLVQVGFCSLLMLAADAYGVQANESVAKGLFAGAWDNLISSIGRDNAKKIEQRVAEIEGSRFTHTPAPVVAANTAKGGEHTVKMHNGKEIKVNPLFASKPGGPIDERFIPKQNTAQGSVLTAELPAAIDVADEVPYLPKTKEDLKKNVNNLCICPDPLGKGEHAKQRDKFQPWQAPNGYREDLKGVLICGGCRDFLTAEYNREKKAIETEAAKVKELEAAEAKIAELNSAHLELEEKLEKAEKTRATFAGLVKEDPTNADTVEALGNQEKKVADLKAAMTAIVEQMDKLEELLSPNGNVKEEPVVAPAAIEEAVANTAKGNEKLSSSAAARAEQHKQHGKKNKKNR